MHGSISTLSTSEVRVSDIESVQHEIEGLTCKANNLVGMAATVADRLYGARAEPNCGASGPTPVPSGAMGEVNSRLASLRSALNTAEDQLSRLNGLV